jgi:dienelactone hydrolase
MRRACILASPFAGLMLLVGLIWLGQLEAAGPPHARMLLEGGVPATLYLPGVEGEVSPFLLLEPPVRETRPPAVVLVHGFASDRAGLSALARSLAVAGYAVLAIDLRGHGANRNPFTRDRVRGEELLAQDIAAAVDALHVSPHVDGTRIAVMGHSMGAGASLDYGTRDSGIDGLVLISGGWRLRGPYRPPNALFITAAGDPERISSRAAALSSRLAGVEQTEPGRTYGSFTEGSAVRRVEVPGADHASIVFDSEAVGEIVAWLDGIFERRRSSPARRADPRLPAAGLAFLGLLLALPGIGLLVGRLAPRRDRPIGDRAALRLGALAAALLASLPLFAVATPGTLISLEVADVVVMHLFAAGASLWVLHFLRGRSGAGDLLEKPIRTLAAAAAGWLAVYLAMTPIGVVFHQLTLTPERAVVALGMTALLLPFTSVFHWMFRRGDPLRASLVSLAGRALVVGILILGATTGISSGVVLLMLPMLVFLFLLFEVVCTAIYAESSSTAVAALLEAGWLAWILAAVLPIRI